MSRYCLPLDDNSSASENACPGENLPIACFSSAAIERITIGETRSNMKDKRRAKERKEKENRFFGVLRIEREEKSKIEENSSSY